MAEIFGTSGHDYLVGTDGDDVINGGAGDDVIDGGFGADFLYGGAGVDIFDFTSVRIIYPAPTKKGLIDGGDGYDFVDLTSVSPASLTSVLNSSGQFVPGISVGNQSFELRNVEEVVFGDWQNSISTPSNNLTPLNIFAGGGNDTATVSGPVGLFMEAGDDSAFISGYTNPVYVEGLIDGGLGTDTLKFNLLFTVDIRAGTAVSGTQSYEISGFENYEAYAANGYTTKIYGSDVGETILVNALFNDGSVGVTFDGRGGNDTLSGSKGNDTLLGGAGNDAISGGLGGDWIEGGDGDDSVSLGAGTDTVFGGAGKDVFKDSASDFNGDTIRDLSAGDRIIISDANISTFAFTLSGSTLTYSGGAMTLTGFTGKLIASAAVGGGVQLRVATPADSARNDYNGDGRSDILWRHSSGEIGQWLGQPDGSFANNGGAAANAVDSSWKIAGLGDFNGDGRDDILWRHSSGVIGEWQGRPDGGFVNASGVAANAVDNSWSVVGVDDFNGDGRSDVFWRHSSGVITQWLGQPDGSFTNNSGAAANAVDNSWSVAGTGDFNGDGRADVLWRHSSGAFAEWQGSASGALINVGGVMGGAAGTVVGTGDFNGDGFDDVLVRGSAGGLTEWLGQATGQFSAFVPGLQLSDLNWKIAEIGDFDGDGRDDVLWRHSSGANAEWRSLPSGEFVNNGAVPTVTADWAIQSPDGVLF